MTAGCPAVGKAISRTMAKRETNQAKPISDINLGRNPPEATPGKKGDGWGGAGGKDLAISMRERLHNQPPFTAWPAIKQLAVPYVDRRDKPQRRSNRQTRHQPGNYSSSPIAAIISPHFMRPVSPWPCLSQRPSRQARMRPRAIWLEITPQTMHSKG